MPQFDFSTYPSQIFWFALCFITLYLFSYLVILPRIKQIIEKRNNLIHSDKDLANEIALQTEKINEEAQENFRNANDIYQNKIDEITKKSLKDRDEALHKLKTEVEEKVKLSRLEIRNFLESSRTNNEGVILNLTNIIKNKILN